MENKYGFEIIDCPTCNPGTYIGGVLLDYTIKDSERELVFSGNAKRILGL